MKKITLILVLICCVTWGYAQGGAVDQRLYDLYSPSQIATMQTEQPQTLAYLNYYVKNGFQIIADIPEEKYSQFPDITEISYRNNAALTEADLPQLNLLLLKIERGPDQYLTYRIGNTGKVIVFLAPNRVLNDFIANQNNQ